MTCPGKGYGSDTIRLPILGKPYRTVSTCRNRTVTVPYLPYPGVLLSCAKELRR
jgi:hypothetical protein